MTPNTPQSQQQERQYEITEDIVKMVEEECFKAGKIQEGKDNCAGCEYEPKSGPRKGCCDFGKEELIKLLRSRPLTPQPVDAPTDGCSLNESCEGCTNQPVFICSKQIEKEKMVIAAAARKEVLHLLDGPQTNIEDFLDWIAGRLVHVYGENENVDYVISLRKRASSARDLRNSFEAKSGDRK